ncbi:MAG: polymerase subunit beta [Frankiales bacterium]|nr:polymerase subunit beta [Frankiales bacterium]
MKFRIERDALADAVAWSARSLPARPAAPVLAGLLLDVNDDSLTVSGFDYEVSTQAALEVTAGVTGRALVSGRLLAEITKALPAHPIEFAADGTRVTISCGSSRFTLPTMPDEDYPRLPDMPTTAGTVSSSVFARAVSQVAVAAGKDDTLPMLTGVRLEIDGDRVTLAATDRYRLAVRELTWNPANATSADAQVLVPARTLSDAARSLTGDSELTISLSTSGSGEGIIGFSGTGRRTTTRLLDAQFPPYRTLLPTDFAVTAEVNVATLSEAVKRVALVADRGNPVRLDFSDGTLTLTAGGDDEGRAEESLEVQFEGDDITTAFNPAFLLEGLNAIEDPIARLMFTTPTKPAVIRPAVAAAKETDYTYLIMPVRLPG